ncbi:MAG: lysyl-tRNA synthetase, class, partial [Gaiellales bacterium]|nr:lysyl-tRNA synthetase, class [Gaiellales bacterium]
MDEPTPQPDGTERHDTEETIRSDRIEKVERVRQGGRDPYPARFEGRTAVAPIRERFGELEAGAETEERVRLAGRVMGRRGHGKAMFLDLEDVTGRIQLHATVDTTEEYETLTDIDLGDLVGIEGEVFCSRRGELSVHVAQWTLLAKNLRPLPEKWHGLTDTELRYRHRYVDLITSEESRRDAIARSRAVSAIRRTLDDRGFIEVETPVLQPIYGGAAARPFTTFHNELERTMYLRIATELYLKRLIVGGLERVYELG